MQVIIAIQTSFRANPFLEGIGIKNYDGNRIPRAFLVEELWGLGDEVFLGLANQVEGSIRCYSRGVKITFSGFILAPELIDEFLRAMKVLKEA